MKPRKYLYLVGIGEQGVSLHHHYIEAYNLFDACQKAHRAYLSPNKGFDCISVTRIKKGGAKNDLY